MVTAHESQHKLNHHAKYTTKSTKEFNFVRIACDLVVHRGGFGFVAESTSTKLKRLHGTEVACAALALEGYAEKRPAGSQCPCRAAIVFVSKHPAVTGWMCLSSGVENRSYRCILYSHITGCLPALSIPR